MKKSIKIIALIYVGVAAFTYALSLRVDRLEAQDEYQIQKESLVFRLKCVVVNDVRLKK